MGTPGALYDAGSGLYYIWPAVTDYDSDYVPTFMSGGLAVPPGLLTSDMGYYFDGTGPDFEGAGGTSSQLDITVIPGQTLVVDVPLRD